MWATQLHQRAAAPWRSPLEHYSQLHVPQCARMVTLLSGCVFACETLCIEAVGSCEGRRGGRFPSRDPVGDPARRIKGGRFSSGVPFKAMLCSCHNNPGSHPEAQSSPTMPSTKHWRLPYGHLMGSAQMVWERHVPAAYQSYSYGQLLGSYLSP